MKQVKKTKTSYFRERKEYFLEKFHVYFSSQHKKNIRIDQREQTINFYLPKLFIYVEV